MSGLWWKYETVDEFTPCLVIHCSLQAPEYIFLAQPEPLLTRTPRAFYPNSPALLFPVYMEQALSLPRPWGSTCHSGLLHIDTE